MKYPWGRTRHVFAAYWFSVWRCRWPRALAHEWDHRPKVRCWCRWLIVMKQVPWRGAPLE